MSANKSLPREVPPRSAGDSLGSDEEHLHEADDLESLAAEPTTEDPIPGWLKNSYEQWSRAISNQPLLSREEEIELAKRMEQGDSEARDRFIESNLKLVVSLAKRYRGLGVPMEDLIQEGNIGLIKAVDRFDYRKGCRFSTCAVAWIEGQIRRSIQTIHNTIRLPLRVIAELRKVKWAADQVAQKLGRDPTPQEIANNMGVPLAHVQDLLSVPVNTLSLDEVMYDDVDSFLTDVMEDEAAVFPEDALIIEEGRRQVLDTISRLPPRHQDVVRMRFGLDDESVHTLQEVGNKLNITRQRVWQIEREALKEIKCLGCPKILNLPD